jgi:hypothetical protein
VFAKLLITDRQETTVFGQLGNGKSATMPTGHRFPVYRERVSPERMRTNQAALCLMKKRAVDEVEAWLERNE